jgi:GT2 family glycosyltransferase
MKNPKVFIIILNYNGKDTIKKCLDSVFYSDYPNSEVVVVDNDSKDGSLEFAKGIYSKFHFIKNAKNSGFSAGNNIGIRFALEKMADYVFLLNNDASLEKDALSKLIMTAEKEKAGIFSPIIYNRKNRIWFSGGTIKWLKMRAVHKSRVPEETSPYSTNYASGCAMLIKKEVFKKTGLLSEDYFLYYEDADFCIKAWKNGFKCLVVPDAKITHFEKSESDLSNKIYWLVISGLIFFEKNTPKLLKIWVRPYLHLRKVKNILDNLNDRNKYAPVVKKAYADFKVWKQNRKYPLSS